MTGVAGEPRGYVAGESRGYQDRFPGFKVLSQAGHWDQVTADAVTARVGPPPVPKFFSGPEKACALTLVNLLTGQNGKDDELAVPVFEMVDARLTAGETDGWRYDDMPEDGEAWRETLAYLDADAEARYGTSFADAPEASQAALVQAVQDLEVRRLARIARGSRVEPVDQVRLYGLLLASGCLGRNRLSRAWPTRAATRTPG